MVHDGSLFTLKPFVVGYGFVYCTYLVSAKRFPSVNYTADAVHKYLNCFDDVAESLGVGSFAIILEFAHYFSCLSLCEKRTTTLTIRPRISCSNYRKMRTSFSYLRY